ncbi:Anti-sigma B factor RsbT [Minicystis rosea]|nr:Anti-sigma B factor RsbT [Minicystis rosea]
MLNTTTVDPPTRDIADEVMRVLLQHVSSPTAQSILSVARQRGGVTNTQITRLQLRQMLDSIERSLVFFVGDAAQARACRLALEILANVSPSPAGPVAQVVKIVVEDDIARARNAARMLAGQLGFSLVGQTRLMTAVSELARNIVQYAGEGQVELSPRTPPPGVEIVAKDRGPGIPNLDRILAGNYRSRLGMGLGLRGVRSLAERFDVRTDMGRGTTVTAMLRTA